MTAAQQGVRKIVAIAHYYSVRGDDYQTFQRAIKNAKVPRPFERACALVVGRNGDAKVKLYSFKRLKKNGFVVG